MVETTKGKSKEGLEVSRLSSTENKRHPLADYGKACTQCGLEWKYHTSYEYQRCMKKVNESIENYSRYYGY